MWWLEPGNKTYEATPEPLKRFSVLDSHDLDEAQEFVGSVFCPHSLRPVKFRGTPAGVRMNHAPIHKTSVNYLKYGAPVEVEPGMLNDFFLVQVQLEGIMKVKSGGQKAEIGPGQASVLSPSEYTHMLWTADSAEVILRLQRETIERQLSALLGSHLPDPLVFDVMMDCSAGAAASWWRALKFLISELELTNNVMNTPFAAKQFEQSLICSLLYGQKHNYTDALHHGLSTAAPRHVKLVEDYIHANADKDITIEELTMVSGVSARSLFAGFKQFRGTSPMKYLRDVRMERVKRDLENARPGDTVTSIAMVWGFCQLGRFAVEYRKAFGESPSETLKKSADR